MKAKNTSIKSQTDWARVSALRDEDIIIDDDSPEMTAEMWAGGVWRRGGVPLKLGKTLVSLRIDTEVLEWFRAQGTGYQSRINALLRAYHDASRVQPAPACGTIRKRPKPKR